MALTKLGNYIEQIDITNENDFYNEDAVIGISTQKMMIPTKANLDGVKLTSYKLLPPNHFAFVPDTSRRGDKMSLCFNNTNDTFLVSSISVVFRVKNPSELNSDYLYMFFNRPEFDRFARFNSWGSARETFTWDDMCDIDIELPSLEIQKKYVDIYNAMVANQQSYERGLDDLKLVCDGYIEALRRKSKRPIGDLISEINNRNTDETAQKEMGVSITKEFIPTKAKSSDIATQKKVGPRQFAFNTNTSRNSDTISIAINDSDEEYAVSNTYCTFKCNNDLIPEYLYIWLKREEFDRYARYNSWGSARETLGVTEVQDYEIAVPSKEIQKDLVNILEVYNRRKQINKQLIQQIKDICPILIKGSVEEAKQEE